MRAVVTKNVVQFAFTGYGVQADAAAAPADCLYLDAGNCLAPGIIDQHHLAAVAASTARLVLQHPELIDAAVSPQRAATDPFTIVLHRAPDLDCLASVYLAMAYLEHGTFPPQAEALVAYVDQVDQGYLGASLEQPFTLYSAYNYLVHRAVQRNWDTPDAPWVQCVHEGLTLVDFVVAEMGGTGQALTAIDAFSCPGLFTSAERQDIQRDVERYHHKLRHPASHTRVLTLSLPGQGGGWVTADTLLIRDVQNADDPARCLFFKDWARADRQTSPQGHGFVGLCVCASATPTSPARGIISVRPDSGASLQGLGQRLDAQEATARRARFGVDDRVVDPQTHVLKRPREGYTNSDPWYDGRAHHYTIVDAPRQGTLLSADEIEGVFVAFAACSTAVP